MEWGFIWLMFVLKIPIVMLLYLVWWAVKQTDEPAADTDGGDGGIRKPRHPRPRPSRPRRRGPHGDPAVAPPARVRSTVTARARIIRG